jgi:hypothetical protein
MYSTGTYLVATQPHLASMCALLDPVKHTCTVLEHTRWRLSLHVCAIGSHSERMYSTVTYLVVTRPHLASICALFDPVQDACRVLEHTWWQLGRAWPPCVRGGSHFPACRASRARSQTRPAACGLIRQSMRPVQSRGPSQTHPAVHGLIRQTVRHIQPSCVPWLLSNTV